MIGETFSHYRITGKLGSGGMGDVYRAEDAKLRRDVAIKVLPEAFARDEERMKRFEREAQVLASLNHPNVAAIYGLEEANGTRALVLELVEGPTLAERIAAGPLPLEEATRIARQIVLGLEAAHDKSIIHRDLKPANVKLTEGGDVKILDFGLAKALDAEAPDADSSHSPTMTRAATQAGVLLGTAGYMSPEQAKGKRVDRRTDIWAFGVVLFEMLTGKTLFSGETVSEILASVIKDEPDLERLPATTPPHIRRLLRRCLTKDPIERLQAIGEARIAIDKPERESGPPASERFRPGAWIAAVAASLVAGTLGYLLNPDAPRPLARFVATPPASDPSSSGPGLDVAITPDGSRIVYSARGETRNQLVVRALDRLETTELTVPETVRGIFLSPDGLWVGYGDGEGRLWKVSIRGGPSVLVSSRRGYLRGASWGTDGTIVWSAGGRLLRVPEGGGEPVELTRPEVVEHYWPEALPGGRAILYTIVAGDNTNSQIALLSLASAESKILVPGGTSPRYAATGHIVYGFGGTLRAVGFDLDRLEVTSDPVPVLEGVVTKSSGAADFGIAQDGSLVYFEGDPLREFERTLVWVDRSGGEEEALAAPPRSYFYPRLSPEGSRLAVDVRDEENDIWIWNFARETLTRLTFDPGPDQYPSFSPDGLRIAFGSGATQNLFWRASDGTGSVERFTESENNQFPHGFSPDGRFLVYREEHPESAIDLGLLVLQDGKSSPLLSTPFSERNAEISPDGRFLAYETDESGRYEVYVRPFPDVDAGRWQVSRDGGGRALWARNGRELFYMDLDGQVLAVPVETEPSFSFGNAAVVVEAGYFAGPPYGRPYDVSPDGSRFLMIKEGEADGTAELIYVQNWTEELKRLVPTGRAR